MGVAPLIDAGGGSGGAAGFGGAGASSGSGGAFEPRCGTLDDGAEVLADDLVNIRYPETDGTHLYYPFHAGGPDVYVIRLYKLGLEVGAPLEEIHTGSGYVMGFVLGQEHVWWAQRPSMDVPTPSDLADWNLSRVPKSGGAVQVMVKGRVGGINTSPAGVIVARARSDSSEGGGVFQLVPWAGGPPTDACEFGAVDWFAANASAVAWIHFRAIETCPLAGGAPVEVLALSELSRAFTVDATHAYWRDSSGIYRVPLAGGERETVTASAEPALYGPASLILDGEEIYFVEGSRIQRVARTGGVSREVVPLQNEGIAFFTLSATHVYWGEGKSSNALICVKRKLK